MKKLGDFGIFLITFLFFTSMVWAERGVTDTEVKIATHTALTGPAALIGTPIAKGNKLFFDYLNAQGGVNGRKVTFISEDDQFLPSRAKEVVKKLITKDEVFSIISPLQGGGTLAAIPDINKAKMPVLFVMSALDELFTPTQRYIFGWCIPYDDSTGLWVKWAADTLKTKRMATVHMWGQVGDTNVKAFESYTKKVGIELVHNEKLKNVKMDYSGLISKIKSEKADTFFITTTAQWTIPILKEIERQAWKTNIIVGMSTANPELLAQLGGSAAEGVWVTMNHVPTDYDDETMTTYRKILKEFGGGEPPSMYHFIGYASAKNTYEALQQTGRDLTAEKVIDTLEKWKDYETGWVGKISYGPDDHVGEEGQILVKMVNGKGIVQGPRIYFKKY